MFHQHPNHPVTASEATINLHWERGQELRVPNPHSATLSVVLNKRKQGAPHQNNKNTITQNIRLIVPGTGKYGLITAWLYLALDDGYWLHLIKQLGTHPLTWNGPKPNPWLTPPPRLSRRASALSTPPHKQAPTNSPPHLCARYPHFTPTPQRCNAPHPSPRWEASPRREK